VTISKTERQPATNNQQSVCLIGPPGAGKTAQLIGRMTALIERGARPDRILVLVPQQSFTRRFRDALAGIRGEFRPRGEPEITTIAGLAQRHVSLFFPLIAARAGFAGKGEPVFVNVELAQYFLNQIVEPRKYDFDDLKLYRPRLLVQILDNLNKSAVAGFPLEETSARLGSAWAGEPRRLESYARAQEIALAFRKFCLAHNVIDFSLMMETWAQHLLPEPSYLAYITARYRHLIADNLEENRAVMHDFVRALLPVCDSALLALDDPGGYRLFLGADVAGARQLAALCDETVTLAESHTGSPEVVAFAEAITQNKKDERAQNGLAAPPITAKYWAGMVKEVAAHIARLVADGVPADEIAVLAPFVEDVLRFELEDRLREHGISVNPLRPSRPLFDHPITRALIVLAKLAHPAWAMSVSEGELARALSACIDGFDLARAQLIAADLIKHNPRGLAALESQERWNRVGMRFFERYHRLQSWLSEPRPAPLDLFWQQLFSDVLSQPGFGLSAESLGAFEAANAADKLIKAARTFRETIEDVERTPLPVEEAGDEPRENDIGRDFIQLLSEGILAAQYDPPLTQKDAQNAVLLAPIYAYLTNDLRSQYQFWLDINSLGWHERIYQPLTHPYVLSRQWKYDRSWTEMDEHAARDDMFRRVMLGLAYRCARGVFVASSQISLTGQEEAGPLAKAIQKALR